MMANKYKNPWPTRAQVRGGKAWVPHPKKKGYEVNVMTGDERKIKPKRNSRRK